MKDQSVEVREGNEINNNIYNKLLSNKANITGISFERHYSKKENKKINLPNDISLLSPNNKTNINYISSYYNSLNNKEKLKYILKLLKNPIKKEPFDFLAVKRKKFTLGYLIRQFDKNENSSHFEENVMCKNPYPLLNCISNRKLGNNSTNFLAKILWQDKSKLTPRQANIIRKSYYTKIFNTDISNLLKNKIRSKTNLKKTIKQKNNINNNNKVDIGTFTDSENFPFLNKYIKSKVNNFNYNYNYGYLERCESSKSNPTSIDFTYQKNNQLYLHNHKMKKWNSTYNLKHKGHTALGLIKRKKMQYSLISIKNRTVSLENHRNNRKNITIINDRKNKLLEKYFYGKRHNKSDNKLNDIIYDISHLKFNNQLKPFSTKLEEL